MHRTTIMLPAGLKSRAERQAVKAGVSLGEFIRRSLEQATAREPAADTLLADNVVFKDDGPRDLAQRHDDYLYGAEE